MSPPSPSEAQAFALSVVAITFFLSVVAITAITYGQPAVAKKAVEVIGKVTALFSKQTLKDDEQSLTEESVKQGSTGVYKTRGESKSIE